MEHKMRRSKQQLSAEAINAVIARGTSGVLALFGEDGYPYAVPLSYVYEKENRRFLFHASTRGHKIEAMRHCTKASFCIVDQDHVVPEEYTTYFRSVIAFGTLRFITEEAEKRATIEALAKHYAPDNTEERMEQSISGSWKALQMIELKIERMTGKQALELVDR